MERIGHYIGGKHVLGGSGRRGPVYDPATGEQTHEVDFADTSELDQAVEAAKEALPAWRATSLSKRAEIMFRIRELDPRVVPHPLRRKETAGRIGSRPDVARLNGDAQSARSWNRASGITRDICASKLPQCSARKSSNVSMMSSAMKGTGVRDWANSW